MNRNGFTLLELVVAIVILSVISGITFAIIFSLVNTRNKEAAQAETTSRVREALDLMNIDIKQGAVILLSHDTTYNPAGSCQLAGVGPTFTHNTNATGVILHVPSVDSAGAAIVGANDIIIYYRNTSGGYDRLCRKVLPTSGSSRSQTAHQLLNNISFDSAFSATQMIKYYDPDGISLGTCWSGGAPCWEANSIELGLTQTYINERTGRTGFQGPEPEINVTQRFFLKNF